MLYLRSVSNTNKKGVRYWMTYSIVQDIETMHPGMLKFIINPPGGYVKIERNLIRIVF